MYMYPYHAHLYFSQAELCAQLYMYMYLMGYTCVEYMNMRLYILADPNVPTVDESNRMCGYCSVNSLDL